MDIEEAKRTFRSSNRDDYPELAGYTREQIYDETIGGGALYLAARMTRTMHLRPGDIVLDLGCGRGATSIFLARHFGVRVVAVDLWTPATELYRRIEARGFRDSITPLNLDVRERLPFADEYFDAIFCMNSFNFYGSNLEFLRRILGHLSQSRQLCIGSEVLSEEFTPKQDADPPYVYSFRLPPPNEGVDVFTDDFMTQHSPPWWREFFQNSGLLTVTDCHELEDADVLYEDLTLYEHEHNIDPFDVEILLQQIEWGRQNRPRKSLFTITAEKR